MPATTPYSPTGDAYVDGVLMGTKWAVTSFTFSFPTDPSFYGSPYGNGEPTNGFAAFTAVQQNAVSAILQSYSAVANVTFTQITETATQHADLRYAESNSPSTAWAYYPTSAAVGGDAWFNNSSHWYDNPVVGNYAWLTMIHETGHAMGLKHPHEVIGSFGAMPLDHDSLEYSVMSYRSYVGASTTTGYTNGTYSYPQTLMMYDIAGLQQLYGANYNTNSGNTVYKWNPTTGQETINGVAQTAPGGNKIFMTLWDGGGQDTYDFSNYTTNLKVDLQPGHWTTVSTAQLADLNAAYAPGTKLAAGNIANALLYQNNTASLIENAIGGSGNDSIVGNVANNSLKGGAGNDALDGLAGVDTAIYSGLSTNYSQVHNADGTWTLTDLRAGSADGTDTLANIEFVQFSDGVFAVGTNAGTAVNHAPSITSGTQSGSVTEWADNSPAETANTPHVASGTLTYSDADATDTHSASFAANGASYLGTFTLDTTNIDSGSGGSVGWSFSVADSAIDYLAAGQTLTQSYDVTVADGHGGTATQTVTVTITGAADAVPIVNSAPSITSGTQAGSVTEWVDNSTNETNNVTHLASGALTYTDADATDAHTASFVADGSGYLGTFTLNTANIDTGNGGSVGWNFSVADSAIDYLTAGQTLTQAYDVTVSDGHGGTATQTVTVTITGAADNSAPVITSATQSGSVTEWNDNSANEKNNVTHVTSGALTYTDADATDMHTASFVAKGSGYLGTFALNTTNIDTGDSIGWAFSVSDKAIDYLAAGQKLTQAYDVTISDGHGGTAVQTVTITIIGASDGKGGPARGAVVAGNSPSDHHAAGDGQFSDIVNDQVPAPAGSDVFTFDFDHEGPGSRHDWNQADLWQSGHQGGQEPSAIHSSGHDGSLIHDVDGMPLWQGSHNWHASDFLV